ncbi:MAG: SAM-dependent methyltransferase [Chitinophagaceae bacterium]|jgi:16S rRNA (cytidine1402-2'-O)-methyltransferase|nr:SAM-dependent methyltransferase [Chitinophagaceae bacterium]
MNYEPQTTIRQMTTLNPGTLLLIPTVLSDTGYDAIPAYVRDAVQSCGCFFVENERTARRYLKKIWPEMVIDAFQWSRIDPEDHTQQQTLLAALRSGQNVGILSEAGCPGVADPGQVLVAWAQEAGIPVKPLVGPNSILLALMASGMNGQHFCFHGYLPVKEPERSNTLRALEAESRKKNSTQIFIETPYRNHQLAESILSTCQADTRLCIAADITGPAETVRTKKISEWKKDKPAIGKVPAIFLLEAGR